MSLPLSQSDLKAQVHYEPESGVFTRLTSRRGAAAGQLAGCVSRDSGYVLMSVNGRQYRAHRLAWLYVTGEWLGPGQEVDHINRVRHDNRFVNLRLASGAENRRNSSRRSNNTSGFKGVIWHKQRQRWRACTSFQGKHVHLGLFDKAEDAHAAYLAWAQQAHGRFFSGAVS